MTRRINVALLFGGMLTAVVAVPSSASGALLTGTFSSGGSVIFSKGLLDFAPPVGPPNGIFAVGNAPGDETGGFVVLAGTNGNILDLNDVTVPPGVNVSLVNFMTFAAAPNISITLNLIQAGVFSSAQCFVAPAAGQNCTPPAPSPPNPPGTVSPFNLTNLSATQSTASFAIVGTEVDSSTGLTMPITGLFTAQFPVQSFQSLLNTINSGGSISVTYSASFGTTSSVPEPATALTFLGGAGLLIIGLVRRKKS